MTKRAYEVAIIVLVVVNALELALFLGMHRRSGLYRSGDQFPPPSGYLLTNSYAAPRAAPCYLIRLSSRGCPYCRLDQSQYASLLQRTRRASCQTIVMAPMALVAESFEDPRVVQLQYVDMKFGQTLNPFLTPQTILLDSQARVIWSRAGTMDKPSLAQAISALDTLDR